MEETYKLNDIELVEAINKADRYAKKYLIEFSEDGEYYETVCEATATGADWWSRVDTSACTISGVKYVKFTLSNASTSGWGYQFYEMAVITKDKSLNDDKATINLSSSEYEYTGEAVKPDVSVQYDEKTLREGVDYRIFGYENNINVGPAKATIEGTGSYAGSKEVEYTITQADIAKAEVSASFDAEGKESVTVTYNGKTLQKDTDYTYETSKTEEGDMSVTISGKGNFKGTKNAVISVSEYPVFEAENVTVESPQANTITVSFENPDTFAGDRQVYDVYIDDEVVAENVAAGSHTYEKQNAGLHKVVVAAKLNGQTAESGAKEVEVSGTDISAYTVEVSGDTHVYNGTAIEAEFKVAGENQEELVKGTDYTVSYENNVNAGTATIKITGIGLYEGTLEATFEIKQKNIAEEAVDFSNVKAEYTYTGQAVTPQVTVAGLTANTDYRVTYSNNTAVGTATITVTGIGNYSGQVTKTFTIKKAAVNPTTAAPTTAAKKTTVKVGKTKVTNAVKKKGANKINLKIKRVKGAKRYQVQISVTKKFKKVLVRKTVKKVKVVIKNKKLKNRKKLYVRARAMKTVKNRKYYGRWSAGKKVKIR